VNCDSTPYGLWNAISTAVRACHGSVVYVLAPWDPLGAGAYWMYAKKPCWRPYVSIHTPQIVPWLLTDSG